jgi:hypothetical protein
MLRKVSVVLLPALLCGCASWNFVTRDLGEPKTGVSVDIKQRMVFINKNDEPDKKKWTRVCAEPSPDALSSFSASVGASVLRPSGSTTQAGISTSEAAAFIGLRTQSIQLMRDAMYRACEAYMSGAIGEEDYLLLQRRFQAQVVGLLAIEQLTGTIAAQPITVNTNSAASAGGGANEEADRLATARKQLAEQQNKQAASKKAADDAKAAYDPLSTEAIKAKAKKPEEMTDGDKKAIAGATTAKDALDKANEQQKLDESLLKIYTDAAATAEEDFKQAKGRVRTSASSGASIPIQIQQQRVSEASISKVADSVQFIITKMFRVAFSDTDDVCYRRMFASVNDRDLLKALAAVCQTIKQEEEADLNAKLKEEEKVAAARATTTSPEIPKQAGGKPPTIKPPKKDPAKGSSSGEVTPTAGATPEISPTKIRRDAATATVKALDRVIKLPPAASAPASGATK